MGRFNRPHIAQAINLLGMTFIAFGGSRLACRSLFLVAILTRVVQRFLEIRNIPGGFFFVALKATLRLGALFRRVMTDFAVLIHPILVLSVLELYRRFFLLDLIDRDYFGPGVQSFRVGKCSHNGEYHSE